MRDNFELIQWKFDREIKIRPLSDLHYGSQGFMQKEWQEFKKQILNDPDLYIVIAGDMLDNTLKSSIRKQLRKYSKTCITKRMVIQRISKY